MGQVPQMSSAAGELLLRLACMWPLFWVFSAPLKVSPPVPHLNKKAPSTSFLNIDSVFFANAQKSCKCGKIISILYI